MRWFSIAAAALGLGVLSSDVAFTQAKPAATPSLEGVWENMAVTSKGGTNPDIPNRPRNINILDEEVFQPGRRHRKPDGSAGAEGALVAKNVGVMTGPPIVQEFKLEGDTLFLTTRSAAGQPASETRLRLMRVR